MIEITDSVMKSHVEKIKELVDYIPEHTFSVLVGPNGSGKSLVRKLINTKLYKEYGYKSMVHVSMELRTQTYSELGALCGIFHDNDSDPTSLATYRLISNTINSIDTGDKLRYLIIDEPEIGMSVESQLSIADQLSHMKDTISRFNCIGILVITHSPMILDHLIESGYDFSYIGYNECHHNYTKYCNRYIPRTDFDWLSKWSSALFDEVQSRQKKV